MARFSLRTLLEIVAVAAFCCGLWSVIRRERLAADTMLGVERERFATEMFDLTFIIVAMNQHDISVVSHCSPTQAGGAGYGVELNGTGGFVDERMARAFMETPTLWSITLEGTSISPDALALLKNDFLIESHPNNLYMLVRPPKLSGPAVKATP